MGTDTWTWIGSRTWTWTWIIRNVMDTWTWANDHMEIDHMDMDT